MPVTGRALVMNRWTTSYLPPAQHDGTVRQAGGQMYETINKSASCL